MTLLERVKELCSESKVSQRTVEKECGLSNGSITKWKTSNPSSDTVQKVAEFFNVSTDWLNGTSEVNYPPPKGSGLPQPNRLYEERGSYSASFFLQFLYFPDASRPSIYGVSSSISQSCPGLTAGVDPRAIL